MPGERPSESRYRDRPLFLNTETKRELRRQGNLEASIDQELSGEREKVDTERGTIFEAISLHLFDRIAERYGYVVAGQAVDKDPRVRAAAPADAPIVPPWMSEGKKPVDFGLYPLEQLESPVADLTALRTPVSIEVKTRQRSWTPTDDGFQPDAIRFPLGYRDPKFKGAPMHSPMRGFGEHWALLASLTTATDAKDPRKDPMAHAQWEPGVTRPLNVDYAFSELHRLMPVPKRVPDMLATFSGSDLDHFKNPSRAGGETFANSLRSMSGVHWEGDPHQSAGYLYLLWFYELASHPRIGKKVRVMCGDLGGHPPKRRLVTILETLRHLDVPEPLRHMLHEPPLQAEELPRHHAFILPESEASFKQTINERISRLLSPNNTASRNADFLDAGSDLRAILNADHSFDPEERNRLAEFVEQTVSGSPDVELDAEPSDAILAHPWLRDESARVGSHALQEASELVLLDEEATPWDLRKVWLYVRHDPVLVQDLMSHPVLAHLQGLDEVAGLRREIKQRAHDPTCPRGIREAILEGMGPSPHWPSWNGSKQSATASATMVTLEVAQAIRELLASSEVEHQGRVRSHLRALANTHAGGIPHDEVDHFIGSVQGVFAHEWDDDLARIFSRFLPHERRGEATERWRAQAAYQNERRRDPRGTEVTKSPSRHRGERSPENSGGRRRKGR